MVLGHSAPRAQTKMKEKKKQKLNYLQAGHGSSLTATLFSLRLSSSLYFSPCVSVPLSLSPLLLSPTLSTLPAPLQGRTQAPNFLYPLPFQPPPFCWLVSSQLRDIEALLPNRCLREPQWLMECRVVAWYLRSFAWPWQICPRSTHTTTTSNRVLTLGMCPCSIVRGYASLRTDKAKRLSQGQSLTFICTQTQTHGCCSRF